MEVGGIHLRRALSHLYSGCSINAKTCGIWDEAQKGQYDSVLLLHLLVRVDGYTRKRINGESNVEGITQ